ncbi:MAG: DUF1592 domain-containing protein [Myxococcota bacterium]
MLATLVWLVTGCGSNNSGPEPEEPVEEVLPTARMYRLTDAEFRATVEATFGVDYAGALPRDTVLHGYRSVGAGAVTVSPTELEAYEEAAWAVANAAVPGPEAVVDVLGCRPTGLLGRPEPERLAPCVGSGLAPLASQAWRRPVAQSELDRLVDLWRFLQDATGSDVTATRAAISAIVLSPAFLYRIEVGEPVAAADGAIRRYTSWELASRLSYFLVDGPPDAALRADAGTGALHDREVLIGHAARLFDSPAGRAAMVRFWEETLELDRLDTATKNADVYPELDSALREAMKTEMRRLFEHVVFETEAPFGDLLTTEASFADPPLAALYGVSPSQGPAPTSVAGTDRGGILGRAALLTIWSHATDSSPTLRGKFVRTRLLCQAVPPPPEGVVATLDEAPGEGAARERLAQHANDPACASCHELTDPPGLALEHFDAIGRWRPDDGGFPIDTRGTLDGIDFAGPRELGVAVAAHEAFPGCVALQLYRHAMGAAETEGELPTIARLGKAFADDDQSLRSLVLALVESDAFLRSTTTLDRSVDHCGPGVEVCNGIDDDCDGDVDEDVVQVCDGGGVTDCGGSTCVIPLSDPETCNGIDDDGDGSVDEGTVLLTPAASAVFSDACDPASDDDSRACRIVASSVCQSGCRAEGFLTSESSPDERLVACVSTEHGLRSEASFDGLALQHPGCDGSDPLGSDCRAAVHRTCAQMGYPSGWGPIDHDSDGAQFVCAGSASVTDTTYTTLSTFEPTCNGLDARLGPACNRAIHRFCQSEGHTSGFGPVENLGDDVAVSCLGEAP